MKKALKALAGRAVFAAGMHRHLLGDRGIIVAFHRVNDQTAGDALTVSCRSFARFCAFFKRHYEVLPLGEMVARIDRGESIGGSLAITFDDGYLDNYTVAAPILRHHALPATFFITSQFIGTQTVPCWDADVTPPPRWMSWDQVRALAAQGFTIGGHTRSHANLGEVAGDTARKEIRGGREEIEAELGTAIDLFAYPFGRPDALAEDNRDLVREAGFRCCVSCHGGTVTSRTDPFRLYRVPINDWFADPHQFGLETALSRT